MTLIILRGFTEGTGTAGYASWAADTAYSINQLRQASTGGTIIKVFQAGTSGDTEPIWSLYAPGDPIYDPTYVARVPDIPYTVGQRMVESGYVYEATLNANSSQTLTRPWGDAFVWEGTGTIGDRVDSHGYTTGDVFGPVTPNGWYYTYTVTQGTSGDIEPVWPERGTIGDATGFWTYAGIRVGDLWQANHLYALGAIVWDGVASVYYFTPTLGYSASSPPTFPTTLNGTVGDGDGYITATGQLQLWSLVGAQGSAGEVIWKLQ